MNFSLRNAEDFTEAVIKDNGSLKDFYQIAEILTVSAKVKFVQKQDDFDSIDWEFLLKGQKYSLRYSIYNGISVFSVNTKGSFPKSDKAAADLVQQLKDKLQSQAGSFHV